MSRVQPGSGIVPSVRSVLEESDRAEPEGIGAGDGAGGTANSPARQAPAADADADNDSGAGAGPAGEPPEESDSRPSPPAEGPDSPAGLDPETTSGADDGPGAGAVRSGQLVLGPLASHPAGQLLRAFHRDLEAGNVAGVASRFTRNARHGTLRGQAEIANHYAEAFGDSEARRADLRVLRMERDGDDWEIEADLEIEIQREGRMRSFQRGRSTLRLESRGDALAISRLEP